MADQTQLDPDSYRFLSPSQLKALLSDGIADQHHLFVFTNDGPGIDVAVFRDDH